jgi:predicted MPP superfamily phosphohydrolase
MPIALQFVVPGVTWVLLFAVYRWAISAFPVLARRRRALLAATTTLAVALPILRWMAVQHHVGQQAYSLLLMLTMALAIPGVPLGAARLVSWAIARARTRTRPVPTDAADTDVPAAAMTRRQLAEAAAGTALIGAAGSMLVWGNVRGRHAFELREVAATIPGLPRSLDGYVIVQISDIHAGIYVRERELDEGLEIVRRARPDLVVVTGDIVDFDERDAPLVAGKLGGLSVRDGVKAILGNHDYYAGSAGVSRTLQAAGVDVLVDEGRVLRAADGGFALLGVDDLRSRQYGRAGPQLDRALATVPSTLPRILLSHQPQTVDQWAGQVALQLSGHTHGGQINPGFSPLSLLSPYVAGLYSVNGTTLYVNRGFGTVGPPSRVGAPPEVTRIVLVAG